MRIYLIKHEAALALTASAESEQSATRLEARGYMRCTLGYWRAVRRVNDEKDLRRLAVEDWLERQDTPVETAPLMAKVRG